jgi:hypothetical protein
MEERAKYPMEACEGDALLGADSGHAQHPNPVTLGTVAGLAQQRRLAHADSAAEQQRTVLVRHIRHDCVKSVEFTLAPY